jgi:hypothetical protein
MQDIFDDWIDFNDGRKHIKLFTGEFPGRENEEIKGSILKKEERYWTLNHNDIDLSCVVSRKQGKRISVNLKVYFNTRVQGRFHDEVSIGWGQAYYFLKDCELYIEDLNIRQVGDGRIIPIHRHKNTIRLWKSFEKYLKKTFPEAKHITTPEQDTSYGSFKTLLRSLGYKKLNYILFQKRLQKEKAQQAKPRKA